MDATANTDLPEPACRHDLPRASPLACHWDLDPGTVPLNHGSFGATPRVVLEAQRSYRRSLERDGVKWFVELHRGACDAARAALGALLVCPWDTIAPVPNATIAVATVFSNAQLAPGDEVLVTDHEYPACLNNARRAAVARGAKVVVCDLPFPCPGPDAVAESIERSLTPRTRLAMLSHVTSSSGLVLPLERIVPMLESRGVRVLVDGAHAPGMVPGIDLSTMGASYYTANCHKWICSPKGSAFLYVRPDLQEGFRPLALSNNAEKPVPGRSRFLTEFEYVGTQDMTAFYAIVDALRYMATLDAGGFAGVMRANRELVLRGRDILCDALGTTPAAPDSMIGSICTLALPAQERALHGELSRRPTKYHDALWDRLLGHWGIQVPIWSVPGCGFRTVRISAQRYNSVEQYRYLARALHEELARERDSWREAVDSGFTSSSG